MTIYIDFDDDSAVRELTGKDPDTEDIPHTHLPPIMNRPVNLAEEHQQRWAAQRQHDYVEALDTAGPSIRARDSLLHDEKDKVKRLEQLLEATQRKLRELGIIK